MRPGWQGQGASLEDAVSEAEEQHNNNSSSLQRIQVPNQAVRKHALRCTGCKPTICELTYLDKPVLPVSTAHCCQVATAMFCLCVRTDYSMCGVIADVRALLQKLIVRTRHQCSSDFVCDQDFATGVDDHLRLHT